MSRRRRWLIGVTAAAVMVGLALAWSHFHAASTPGAPSEEVAIVNYYPACGNEVLEHNGTTWYPIRRPEWQAPTLDGSSPAPSPKVYAARGGRGISVSVPMVARPGPGDDRGTLLIYDNGIAYFMSDSGDLATWLTTAPQTYNWEC